MNPNLSPAAIAAHVLSKYQAVALERTGNEIQLAYNPYHRLQNGIPLVSITEIPGAEAREANAAGSGRFRLNVCVSPEWVEARFAGTVTVDYDAIDTITPDPNGAHKGWVSVLDPSHETFNSLKPLIRTTYDCAASRFADRLKRETA